MELAFVAVRNRPLERSERKAIRKFVRATVLDEPLSGREERKVEAKLATLPFTFEETVKKKTNEAKYVIKQEISEDKHKKSILAQLRVILYNSLFIVSPIAAIITLPSLFSPSSNLIFLVLFFISGPSLLLTPAALIFRKYSSLFKFDDMLRGLYQQKRLDEELKKLEEKLATV